MQPASMFHCWCLFQHPEQNKEPQQLQRRDKPGYTVEAYLRVGSVGTLQGQSLPTLAQTALSAFVCGLADADLWRDTQIRSIVLMANNADWLCPYPGDLNERLRTVL